MKSSKSQSKCPYCNQVLTPPPKWGKKCPFCGQQFMIRQGEPVTLEEAKFRDGLLLLEEYGVTRKDFDRHRADLTKQFGFKASVDDTVWRILNSLIAKERDIQILRRIYFEMGRLVSQEGKNPRPYFAEAHKLELLRLKRDGVKTVRIVGCGRRVDDQHACSACKALWGKRFAIDEAMSLLPIPNKCESPDGLCRCEYVSEDTWRELERDWAAERR
jgi:hypothetical protein